MEEHMRAHKIVCKHYRQGYMSVRSTAKPCDALISGTRDSEPKKTRNMLLIKKKIQRYAARIIFDGPMSARIYRLI